MSGSYSSSWSYPWTPRGANLGDTITPEIANGAGPRMNSFLPGGRNLQSQLTPTQGGGFVSGGGPGVVGSPASSGEMGTGKRGFFGGW